MKMKHFARGSNTSMGAFFTFVFLAATPGHTFGAAELAPTREFADDSASIASDIEKSAGKILSGIRTIFSSKSDENTCIAFDRECSLGGGEGCCESLSCLYDLHEASYLCQCGAGSFANDDGICISPEYPNILSAAIWIIGAAVVTLSFSYLLIALFRKKTRPNPSLSEVGYSTFGDHHANSNVHHITSVFSPVVASQVLCDEPPVYQLEEMPPPYEDVIEWKEK